MASPSLRRLRRALDTMITQDNTPFRLYTEAPKPYRFIAKRLLGLKKTPASVSICLSPEWTLMRVTHEGQDYDF